MRCVCETSVCPCASGGFANHEARTREVHAATGPGDGRAEPEVATVPREHGAICPIGGETFKPREPTRHDKQTFRTLADVVARAEGDW